MFWRSDSVRLCARIPPLEIVHGIWAQQRSARILLAQFDLGRGLYKGASHVILMTFETAPFFILWLENGTIEAIYTYD
ncbi:hypothetical protein D3C78_1117620 [compost metagenome]